MFNLTADFKMTFKKYKSSISIFSLASSDVAIAMLSSHHTRKYAESSYQL